MVRRLLPLSLVLLSFCAPASRPPQVAPAPRLAATAVAQRVVLLSFDGLGADALAAQSSLPAFEQLARDGAHARVLNVNPTLTGPTHVSILTGADPQRTGIVSNRFHLPGTPPERAARSLGIDPDVESIVEAARRQGKTVGAVSFPSIDNTSARRSADFGLAWSDPLVPSRLVRLTRTDFRREWVPPTWTARPQRRVSFSPIMRARIEWSVPNVTRTDVDVVAYDTTDDRAENYDLFLVESGERELTTANRSWFAITRRTDAATYGAWSKIVSSSAQLDVTIYWGSIAKNNVWPEAYRELVDGEVGVWPGEPEEHFEVDPELFIEQMNRLADFYARVQTMTIARMPFDLLLLYQPQIDQAGHEYLGTPDGERVSRAAFVSADRAVGAIGDALHPGDAFLVTGDHGLTAIGREVRLNRLLAERGFAPRWGAFGSGNVAHLYRFGEPDDTDALVNMLTSTALFERVDRKSAAHHRNSGDVIAWAWPNVAVSNDETEPAVVTTPPHGHHGALNHHREVHPPFFAIGMGVPRGPLGEIRQTQIARFVAQLLGISPPATAE